MPRAVGEPQWKAVVDSVQVWNFVYFGCVLLVGLVAGFYWARVLKLVVKTRRKAGADAQLVPAEPLGRALRVIWYPTVGVWIVHPLAVGAYALAMGRLPEVRALMPVWVHPAVYLPATLVVLAGMWATLVCWRRMGKSWRMGINPGEKTELVVSGPWGYVAHPIYALSSAIMLGTMAVLPSPLMLIAGVFHLLFLQWEARREERNLVAVHGEVYAGYLRRVGRFVPKSLRAFRP